MLLKTYKVYILKTESLFRFNRTHKKVRRVTFQRVPKKYCGNCIWNSLFGLVCERYVVYKEDRNCISLRKMCNNMPTSELSNKQYTLKSIKDI